MFRQSLLARSLMTAGGLLVASLPLPAQNGSPLPVGQGTIIGVDTGGNWPELASPVGNEFEASPTNPFWPAAGSVTEQKRQLGKLLFWDEQLSSDNTMACGTCHFPSAGGSDPRQLFLAPSGRKGSLGMVAQDEDGAYREDTVNLQQGRRVTGRNPPTMIGSAFFSNVFWNGRAGPSFLEVDGETVIPGFEQFAALEAQAVDPPVSPIEMAHDGLEWKSPTLELEGKIGAAKPLALATPSTIPPDIAPLVDTGKDYATLFDEVFAGEDPDNTGVTRERFAMALATYERTLVPNQAPFDRRALTQQEMNGFQHMVTGGGVLIIGGQVVEGGCFKCHAVSDSDPALRSGGHEGFGVVDPMDALFSDGERHASINIPGNPGGVSRTPTLRNVALRRSIFSNGSITAAEGKTALQRAIEFYNGEIPGGNGSASPNAFTPLTPLSQSEKNAVEAFLHTLTDPRVENELPPFDRPDLYSERVPFGTNAIGSGTPNGGGPVPKIIANAPLLEGDEPFQVGVLDGPSDGFGRLSFSLATGSGPVVWIDMGQLAYQSALVPLDDDGVGTFHAEPAFSQLALVGLTFYAQWTLFATPESGFHSASDGASFRVQ